MSNGPSSPDNDAIIEHIRGLFRAYIARDRDAIRSGHTADWTGFQGPSRQIERGIDAYMRNADESLKRFRGTGFEILDSEIQQFGDVAIVYYVARYEFVNSDGKPGTLPLRSIDVYRRDGEGWNQCGSHITPIPAGGAWGASESAELN